MYGSQLIKKASLQQMDNPTEINYPSKCRRQLSVGWIRPKLHIHNTTQESSSLKRGLGNCKSQRTQVSAVR